MGTRWAGGQIHGDAFQRPTIYGDISLRNTVRSSELSEGWKDDTVAARADACVAWEA